MSAITPNQLIKTALSSARLSTYELATTVVPRLSGSLALYAWNAQVAAAMLVPLHLCEVIIRNAVSDGIEAEYGARWPWNAGFERSLSTKGFDDFQKIKEIITFRCHQTAGWMVQNQQAQAFFANKPL